MITQGDIRHGPRGSASSPLFAAGEAVVAVVINIVVTGLQKNPANVLAGIRDSAITV